MCVDSIWQDKFTVIFKHYIMKTITIEGQLRTDSGKKATRQLRSQNMVPGVIYGGAQEVNFSAPAAAFRKLVDTPTFQFCEVKVDGKSYRTILKDLQFDKVNEELIHVDLLELVEDKKVIANINEAVVYKDVIEPILAAKCYSCHGDSKQKGKLRLDLP